MEMIRNRKESDEIGEGMTDDLPMAWHGGDQLANISVIHSHVMKPGTGDKSRLNSLQWQSRTWYRQLQLYYDMF